MDTFIEYRVRPVTRYIVTRYEQQRSENCGGLPSEKTIGSVGSVGNGEFDNADTAYAVAYALARADHERLGYSLGDERIRYPEHPNQVLAQACAAQVPEGVRHAQADAVKKRPIRTVQR